MFGRVFVVFIVWRVKQFLVSYISTLYVYATVLDGMCEAYHYLYTKTLLSASRPSCALVLLTIQIALS